MFHFPTASPLRTDNSNPSLQCLVKISSAVAQICNPTTEQVEKCSLSLNKRRRNKSVKSVRCMCEVKINTTFCCLDCGHGTFTSQSNSKRGNESAKTLTCWFIFNLHWSWCPTVMWSCWCLRYCSNYAFCIGINHFKLPLSMCWSQQNHFQMIHFQTKRQKDPQLK